MASYAPRRETVISNGQRAMHLQRVNVAVEVSDLAATGSAYFETVAEVGRSSELDTLLPDLHDFTALIALLSKAPAETLPYRALIPAQVWRKGTAEFADLARLDSDIDSALDTLESGITDAAALKTLAGRLRELSRAFAKLSQQELDASVDMPSPAS